jgi:uncharacterized protein YciI
MAYDEAARARIAEEMPQLAVYYLCILKKGPRWTAVDSAELDALQAAHLANFERLRALGAVALNGPFLDRLCDTDDLRGFAIFTTASLTEARELADTDPMIAAGHLAAEIRPIMTQSGVLP